MVNGNVLMEEVVQDTREGCGESGSHGDARKALAQERHMMKDRKAAESVSRSHMERPLPDTDVRGP